jgi:hypothetical protein
VSKAAISLLEQMIGRVVRPLKGLVDHLPNAEARRAAIAASSKPNALVLHCAGTRPIRESASVIDVLYDSLPDAVLDTAVDIAYRGGMPEDPSSIVAEAKEKVAEEERRKREEAERRRQKEEEERARLRARTSYTVDYGDTTGRRQKQPKQAPEMASRKQLNYIWVLGWKDIDQYNVTKMQAIRIITRIHAGVPLETVRYQSGCKRKDDPTAAPPASPTPPPRQPAPSWDDIFSCFRRE